MQIIKDQEIVEDSWQRVEGEITLADIPEGDVIVPYAFWLENKQSLIDRDTMLGVCINGDDLTEEVAKDLEHFQLVAVEFPAFPDGRSYSHARLLRDRYDFQGEIRAVGDVLRDQLLYMQRCGVNAFQLKEGKDIEDALNAFSELSVRYQTAADGAEPVYKYR